VLRFIVAYVLLFVYAFTRKPFRLFASSWKDELLMIGLGVTGGSLYFVTENSAMIYTTTTNTSLIVCLCPLFAALLIALFYRSERLRGIQIAGLIIAAVGAVVVVLNGQFVLHLSPLGDTLAFSACLCWAFYSLLMVPATKRYSTLFITRKVFFYGLLSMIPYWMFYPDMPSLSVVLRPAILWNLLFLGCVASMLCLVAWNWAIKQLGAVVATNYVYFNPVVTAIFAWLVLDEQITIFYIIGTILILAGMFLVLKKRMHEN